MFKPACLKHNRVHSCPECEGHYSVYEIKAALAQMLKERGSINADATSFVGWLIQKAKEKTK